MLGLLVVAVPAARAQSGQAAAVPSAGTEAITAADIARHVATLRSDSMRARDTPSPGLERAARYVAEQFEALGLQPMAAGDSGRMIQRYALPGHSVASYQNSRVQLLARPRRAGHEVVNESGDPVWNIGQTDFATAAVFATDTVLDPGAPGARGGGQDVFATFDAAGLAPVVVAGPHLLAALRQANLHDKVVVYVPPPELDSIERHEILRLLTASNHVIIVADEDSAAFARRRAVRARPPIFLDRYLPEAEPVRRWAVYVWAPAIRDGLATAGFDLEEARTAQAPIVRELSALALLQPVRDTAPAGRSAPNVVGVLQGRDPSRVIVLTAHLDNAVRAAVPAGVDTADAGDNTSGVTGLLALAKAFTQTAQATAPLRFTIVFAAVSGGTKGQWGSRALADRWSRGPSFSIDLDRIGRVAGDSVRVHGLQEVELAARPDWLATQHPELHLSVGNDGSVIVPGSDHFAFVRRAVPSLYVHGSAHEVEGGAAADAVDPEQEARLLRLIFYLTQDLARAPRAAWWTSEGHRVRDRVLGR